MLRDAPETITEPGAYRMPMARYHEDCCAGPSVSSGGLRTIWHKSPAHFWVQCPLNPDAIPKEATKALDFGRAAHALLLGDEDFEANYVVVPSEAAAYPSVTSWAAAKSKPEIEEAKAWWRAFEAHAEGRVQISEEQLGDITHMAESLAAHPAVKHLGLFNGTPEPSMFWEITPGIWVKSRPDMMPSSGNEIADLKTTADISRGFCERQIRTHGYDMQMALAQEGAERTLAVTIPEAVIVFIEKSPPYCVRVVPIDDETLHFARRANGLAMQAFREGIQTGRWPGPADDMLSYKMSQRDMDEINARAGSTGL